MTITTIPPSGTTPTFPGLLTPQEIDDGKALASHVKAWTSAAHAANTTTVGTWRRWQELHHSYSAPEQGEAYRALDGPKAKVEQVSSLVDLAGAVLDEYARTLEDLARTRTSLMSRRAALAKVDTATATEDEVHKAQQYNREVGLFDAEATMADVTCAGKLRALNGPGLDYKTMAKILLGPASATAAYSWWRKIGPAQEGDGAGTAKGPGLRGTNTMLATAVLLGLQQVPGANGLATTSLIGMQGYYGVKGALGAKGSLDLYNLARKSFAKGLSPAESRVLTKYVSGLYEQGSGFVSSNTMVKVLKDRGLWSPALASRIEAATASTSRLTQALGKVAPFASKVLGPLQVLDGATNLYQGVKGGDGLQMAQGGTAVFAGTVFTAAALGSATVLASPVLVPAAVVAGTVSLGIYVYRNHDELWRQAKDAYRTVGAGLEGGYEWTKNKVSDVGHSIGSGVNKIVHLKNPFG